MSDAGPKSWQKTPPVHRQYATERFVEIVIRGVSSPEDPKTIELLSRRVGMTRSPFAILCKTLGIAPQDARDFTRLLRAFVLTRGTIEHPHDVFSISEPKTVKMLFQRAGLAYPVTLSPVEFLDRQGLVRDPRILAELRKFVQSLLESQQHV